MNLKNKIKSLFPSISVMDGKLLYAFLLLQIYFVSNLLSFGFWRTDIAIFGRLFLFYGAWISLLTSLLLLSLIIANRFRLARFKQIILLVFSLPFALEVWLESIDVTGQEILLSYFLAIIAPILIHTFLILCILLYYRFSSPYIVRIAVMMLALSTVSFMNHSDFAFIKKNTSYSEKAVMLDNKKNIHVILLDAFTHSAFSEAFLGVRNSAADYLSSLDNTIDAGYMGFSEYVPTREAWATIFELSDFSVPYNKRPAFNIKAFSGSQPSLLTSILRKNDYYIQTGFKGSDYFGAKGPYIDEYHNNIDSIQDTLICRARESAFLGFCSKDSKYFFEKILKINKDKEDKEIIDWGEKVIQLIEQQESKQRPIFSAFYIYNPIGHTKFNYRTHDSEDFGEYKKYFICRVKRAKKLVKKIDRLRKQYPDSIFIVGGDHGPWLSRTMSKKENPRFFVLDTHGVALALLNASNLCPYSREWLEKQIYLTPSRMLAASLACNGESRKLLDHFEDNEEFIRFGQSLAHEN